MMSGLDASAIRILSGARKRTRPLAPVLRRYLGRDFPAGNRTRVLMVDMDDSIAWPQFYPYFHYQKRFADQGYVFRTVAYPALGAERLIGQADAIFVQAPLDPQPGELEAFFERLRRINARAPFTFFDWFAPTDIRFADRVADHVDFYTKKALLRDRAYYRTPQQSHTALEAYYCDLFDLTPPLPTWEPRPDILDRLLVAPGFITAPAFMSQLDGAPPPFDNDRPIDVHARFAVAPPSLREHVGGTKGKATHWYVAMRQHARDAISALDERYRIAWKGTISKAEFMAELGNSRICFSPFGFGELCWRDIEAILAGAVLLKPGMEHLECFCDIYRPHETYVPVRWDLADLEETIAALLADPERCRAIAEQAFAAARAYLAGPRLETLLDRLTRTPADAAHAAE